MWNQPSDQELLGVPRLYETDNVPTAEKVIQMHFFLGGCDWYVSEYDPNERVFFGFAIFNNDLLNAEWGYISLDELLEVRVPPAFEVDRDLHWAPRSAAEVDRIVQAYESRGQSLRIR